jgi:hypothetical protein
MEDLKHIAHRAMLDCGLLPEFSAAALAQVNAITGPAIFSDAGVRDLSGLLSPNDARPIPWGFPGPRRTAAYGCNTRFH